MRIITMNVLAAWLATTLLALSPITAAGAAAQVRSDAVLVIDASDDAILLARNADVPVPIASITKLMTALVTLEADLPLDEAIRIIAEDRATDAGGPSRIVIGASLTRSELLHLALMSSENRAAYALGRSFPGGMPAILQAMNAKAAALGMKHARFIDTTGLSSGNIASPLDLVKLVKAAARHRLIREYSTDPQASVTVIRHQVEYRNTNLLVRKPEWDIQIQKSSGVKSFVQITRG